MQHPVASVQKATADECKHYGLLEDLGDRGLPGCVLAAIPPGGLDMKPSKPRYATDRCA